MSLSFTKEDVKVEFEKNNKIAEDLLKNSSEMEQFLQKLEIKLRKIPVLGGNLSEVPIMALLIKSYLKKEYKEVPIGTIIAILSALIYFVSPVDLIPDVIPVVGYVDDTAVIGFALLMVKSDLDDYKEWRIKTGRTI